MKTTLEKTPKAVNRLAYQLCTTPEKIIAKALQIGLRNIDWNLAEGCDAFGDGCGTDEFNTTAAMNRLSPKRFAELCEGDIEPQMALMHEHYRSKGISWKMPVANPPGDNVLPFHGPPREIG